MRKNVYSRPSAIGLYRYSNKTTAMPSRGTAGKVGKGAFNFFKKIWNFVSKLSLDDS